MKEFTEKGFENASTNEIVKAADISKGLLFHYFKNKKNLFLFLYDYSMDQCINEFYKKINLDEKDIFIRMKQIVLIKLQILKIYPEIFEFLIVADTENSDKVKGDVNLRNKEIIISSGNIFLENIDFDKFRENIDVKKTINIIIWTFNGIGVEHQKKAKLLSSNQVDYFNQIGYEKILSEMDVYIDIFKKCFYK